MTYRPKAVNFATFVAAIMCLCLLTFTTAQAQYRTFSGAGGAAANSGPNFIAVEKEVDAGNVTVGATSYVVVLFTNDGVSPVELGEITLYPSSTVSANVTLNQCARDALPPGAECAMTVAVAGLQTGAFNVEMLIEHSGRTRLTTAKITGTVEGLDAQQQNAQTEIEAFPETMDFGSVSSGIEQIRSITLRNKTSDMIDIKNIRMEAPTQSGFSYRTNCESLKAGEACIATIVWSPIVKGQSLANLVIEHTGVTGVTRIDISGDYTPTAPSDAPLYPDTIPNSGLLITDRSEFNFETGVESVSAITASLVNVGDRDLTIQDILLSSQDNGITFGRNGCKSGTVLAPNDACPLTVSWAPTRAGSIVDDVQIRHTGARGILVIPVRGEADAAVSRDAISVRTSDGETLVNEVAPNLDGYVITSLSRDKAIISGPIGTTVVRDGQPIILAGLEWMVDVKTTGVELKNGRDNILLVFDRSLTTNRFEGSTTSSGN